MLNHNKSGHVDHFSYASGELVSFYVFGEAEQGDITIATDGCAVYLITYVQSLIFQTVTVSTWKGIF